MQLSKAQLITSLMPIIPVTSVLYAIPSYPSFQVNQYENLLFVPAIADSISRRFRSKSLLGIIIFRS